MAGLLCKDWLLLRRQLWYYALLLGLYLALTAAGVLDASFLCGLAASTCLPCCWPPSAAGFPSSSPP